MANACLRVTAWLTPVLRIPHGLRLFYVYRMAYACFTSFPPVLRLFLLFYVFSPVLPLGFGGMHPGTRGVGKPAGVPAMYTPPHVPTLLYTP